MALELTLEKLDGIDEGVKALYVEKDGKYNLLPAVAELQSTVSKVLHKNEELLTETKAAKAARIKAEEFAKSEAARIAAEAGDYKSLHASAMAELEAERGSHKKLADTIANEKRSNQAMKIAAELAEGANVELLSDFIARRLKYTDEGLKVVDAGGNLTISTVDDLKREFQNDAKYSALLKGNQASGGGAGGGGKGGGAAVQEISRADFEAKSPSDRAAFTVLIREGKAKVV